MSTKRKSSKSGKSGFRRLTKHDDVFTIFTGNDSGRNADVNFAETIEDNLSLDALADAAREKSGNAAFDDTGVIQTKPSPAPEKKIDLHGLTAKEAEAKTESSLQTARGLGLKTVKIITGKGLHSPGQAVLPDIIEQKLDLLKKRGLIRSYCWENKLKSKSGAAIVYLPGGKK